MTDEFTIALDLDSTLAATARTAFDLINGPDHEYDYDDIVEWDWGLEEFGAERYLSGLWHAWTLRPLDVEPMEDDIAAKVERLHEFGTVDIVTAHPSHPGISAGKKQWLDHHDIPYNQFVVADPGQTKAHFGYNCYIDDKPTLPERVTGDLVFVRDQPYNRSVDGDYTRITSLSEVEL